MRIPSTGTTIMEPTNQEEAKMEEDGLIGFKSMDETVAMLKVLNDSCSHTNGESGDSFIEFGHSKCMPVESSEIIYAEFDTVKSEQTDIFSNHSQDYNSCVESTLNGVNGMDADFDGVVADVLEEMDLSNENSDNLGTIEKNVPLNDSDISMPELEKIEDVSTDKSLSVVDVSDEVDTNDKICDETANCTPVLLPDSNLASFDRTDNVPINAKCNIGDKPKNVHIPKARKSCQTINRAPVENTIKTVNLMPIINYKLKIPDIENALRRKEQHLERKRLAAIKTGQPPVKVYQRPLSPKAELLPLSPKSCVLPSPKIATVCRKIKIAERTRRNRRLYWKRGIVHKITKPKTKAADGAGTEGQAKAPSLKQHGSIRQSTASSILDYFPPSSKSNTDVECGAQSLACSKMAVYAHSDLHCVTSNHKTMVSLLTSQKIAQEAPLSPSAIVSDHSAPVTPSVPVSIPRASITTPPFKQDPAAVEELKRAKLYPTNATSSHTAVGHKPDLNQKHDLIQTQRYETFLSQKHDSVPPSPACSSKSSFEGGNSSAKPDYLPLTPDSQVVCTAEEETLNEPMEVCTASAMVSDAIPLCTCKIVTTAMHDMAAVTYCQAVDSVDGKVIGCCNKVTGKHMLRPSVKVPFMSMCELHKSRVRGHQCCPGCGQFCTQGKFYQCSHDGFRSAAHSFHKQCQTTRHDRFYCPHCGQQSEQFEVELSLSDLSEVYPGFSKPDTSDRVVKDTVNRAKISIHSSSYKQDNPYPPVDATLTTVTLPGGKILSSAGLAYSAERYKLEKVLSLIHGDRPKKYRTLPKSMSGPINDGDLEKSLYMIVDGHDPNRKYDELDGCSAIHLAAMGGHLSIVHALIQAGAEVNQTDNQLKTASMYAAEYDHIDVLAYLIKARSNLETKAADGMTCLHLAAMKGNLSSIKVLLNSRQISVNIQDEGGWTAIIWATEHKFPEVVRLLLKFGADPNIKDQEENTALHWSAYSGSADIAEMYLNAGSDVEAVNHNGERPLHIASRQDYYECVVLFLARGAEVDVLNKSGKNPVSLCPDQSSETCRSLKVSQALRQIADKRLVRVEKLVHRDISLGKENHQLAAVNAVDESGFPNDYLYVTENVETSYLHVNRVITSLQNCACEDNCATDKCSCCRSSVLCWYDKEGKLIESLNYQETPFIFECNRACRCWTTCNNRVVQHGMSARLQLFKTTDRGWGCRTVLDIAKGSFICEYIGELISDSEADGREDDSYLFDLDNRDGETYCIDARKYGNVSRFINHLCEPNVVPVKVFIEHQDLRFPRICLFASKDIASGEELGFDYGEKFWMIKWKQFTCACGSLKCKYSTEVIHKTIADYKKRFEEVDNPPQ